MTTCCQKRGKGQNDHHGRSSVKELQARPDLSQSKLKHRNSPDTSQERSEEMSER